MFVPSALVVESADSAMPRGCQPFSLYSDVCIGDLIAIVACSIAGIGFFFWAIHAIRKMRQFPFNDSSEDEEKPEETEGVDDPFHIPSTSDNGVVQTLSMPDRVRVRLALSEPEEGLYKTLAPIPSDSTQGVMTTPRGPRLPQPAGGHSRKSTSHHSGHHGSPMRGGTYGESYEYGANGDYISVVSPSRARGSPQLQGSMATPRGPRLPPPAGGQSRKSTSHHSGHHGSPMRGGAYGESYKYGVNGEYVNVVSPSRAKGSSLHASGGGYKFHQSMGRNGDPTMYAY